MVLNFYKLGKKIPDGAIYIGRGNKSLGLPHSPWHNPFKVSEDLPRGQAAEKYAVFLDEQIASGKIKKDHLAALHGKDLVCYCAPLACHGHVLEKRAAECFLELSQNLAKNDPEIFQPEDTDKEAKETEELKKPVAKDR